MACVEEVRLSLRTVSRAHNEAAAVPPFVLECNQANRLVRPTAGEIPM